MRVVLSADMEAVAQITGPREILACCAEYWATGRQRMTADVVAAAEGLLAAGADEVIVLDNHGSGHAENVIGRDLPRGARLETWNVFDLPTHGVDAMLQVGYHARAGVECFVPHTYVPELRLRVDGEPISETHGRAWAADVPLLGITGHAAHGLTLGSFSGTPFLAVQESEIVDVGVPVFGDKAASDAAIRGFAASSLLGLSNAPRHPPPRNLLFEAALDEPPGDGAVATMIRAGWRQTTSSTFAVELADWAGARAPLAAAMAAATVRMAAAIDGVDLGSAEAVAQGDPVRTGALQRYVADWLEALKTAPRADWPN